MKKLILSLSLMLTTLLPIVAHAQGGGCGGHGGDALSQEFYQIGQSLLSQIKKLPADELKSLPSTFQLSDLETALLQTRVITTDEKLMNDQAEVDAKNFSDNPVRILVNRARFLQYKDQKIKKYGIVLHEYLGIVKGIAAIRGEWDEYRLSSQILALIAAHEKSSALNNQRAIEEIRSAFEAAGGNFVANAVERGMNFSCLEYSLLSDLIAPIPHKNAYSSSTLAAAVQEYIEPQTDSTFKNEIRITARGDLIVAKVDSDTQAAVSVSYCSKLGSKSLQMVRFMSESILPIFDTPKTESFAQYQKKISALETSGAFKGCVGSGSANDCLRLYKKIDAIHLDAESKAVNQAKNNIIQINAWLNSLPEKERMMINAPLLNLFADYAAHQDYLRGLMDINDSTEMHTPYNEDERLRNSVKNFIDSVKNRIPLAYEAAKAQFLQQTLIRETEFIESFSLKF